MGPLTPTWVLQLLHVLFSLSAASDSVAGRMGMASFLIHDRVYYYGGLVATSDSNKLVVSAPSSELVTLDTSMVNSLNRPVLRIEAGSTLPSLYYHVIAPAGGNAFLSFGGIGEDRKLHKPSDGSDAIPVYIWENSNAEEVVYENPSPGVTVPRARAHHAISVTYSDSTTPNMFVWLYGGSNGDQGGNSSLLEPQGDFFDDLWRLDVRLNTWELMGKGSEQSPPGLAGHQLVTLGDVDKLDSLLLIGGRLQSGSMQPIDEVWMYTISSNSWSLVKTEGLVPPVRYLHGACSVRDQPFLYISGGADQASEFIRDNLWVLTTSGGSKLRWEKTFSYSLQARFETSAVPAGHLGHHLLCNTAGVLQSFGAMSRDLKFDDLTFESLSPASDMKLEPGFFFWSFRDAAGWDATIDVFRDTRIPRSLIFRQPSTSPWNPEAIAITAVAVAVVVAALLAYAVYANRKSKAKESIPASWQHEGDYGIVATTSRLPELPWIFGRLAKGSAFSKGSSTLRNSSGTTATPRLPPALQTSDTTDYQSYSPQAKQQQQPQDQPNGAPSQQQVQGPYYPVLSTAVAGGAYLPGPTCLGAAHHSGPAALSFAADPEPTPAQSQDATDLQKDGPLANTPTARQSLNGDEGQLNLAPLASYQGNSLPVPPYGPSYAVGHVHSGPSLYGIPPTPQVVPLAPAPHQQQGFLVTSDPSYGPSSVTPGLEPGSGYLVPAITIGQQSSGISAYERQASQFGSDPTRVELLGGNPALLPVEAACDPAPALRMSVVPKMANAEQRECPETPSTLQRLNQHQELPDPTSPEEQRVDPNLGLQEAVQPDPSRSPITPPHPTTTDNSSSLGHSPRLRGDYGSPNQPTSPVGSPPSQPRYDTSDSSTVPVDPSGTLTPEYTLSGRHSRTLFVTNPDDTPATAT